MIYWANFTTVLKPTAQNKQTLTLLNKICRLKGIKSLSPKRFWHIHTYNMQLIVTITCVPNLICFGTTCCIRSPVDWKHSFRETFLVLVLELQWNIETEKIKPFVLTVSCVFIQHWTTVRFFYPLYYWPSTITVGNRKENASASN